VLVERETDEALEAREEYPALLEDVLVVQGDVAEPAAAAAAAVVTCPAEA